MVAISLYRGNLHRVPTNIPRRWQMPPQSFTTAVFKKLLSRRSKALTRLVAVPPVHSTLVEEEEGSGCCDGEKPNCASVKFKEGIGEVVVGTAQGSEKAEAREDCGVEAKGYDAASARPPHFRKPASKDLNAVVEVKIEESTLAMEERKKEVEKKLTDLKEKKHHLVQMLKMIIGAEEEIMRRTSVQPSAVRVSIPVQTESTFDAAARPVVPKLSVDVNFGSVPGGESECVSKQNIQMRFRHNVPSTSPSLVSPNPFSRALHGSFQHNSVIRTPRGSSINTGNAQTSSNSTVGNISSSPSGQCVTGNQSHLGLPPPPVSVSGTPCVAASLQSPAGSRSASAFKDSPSS